MPAGCPTHDGVPDARRRPRRQGRARRLALTATAVGVVLGSIAPLTSATGAPQPSLEEVRRRVVGLQHQAEVASERYNETREELASVTVRIKAAQAKLERQRQQVVLAKRNVGRLAAETYRRGEFSTLDFLLGKDPDSALAQAGLVPSFGNQQVGAMKRLQDEERRLAAAQADLNAQRRKLEEAHTLLAVHKNTVLQRLAAEQAELNRLSAADRVIVQEASRSEGISGPGGTVACRGFAVQAPDSRVKAVLNFACAQVGDPYVWAGEGPDIWDCSGLTMKAWRAAGVAIPHSSRMQATYGNRVLLADLQAGDLVFFHSPISHVGIYLGGGFMLHAPHSGDVVKVARLWTTPTAAVRL